MVLDRTELLRALRDTLGGRAGSTTEVLGSIAAGTADEYSDVDLRWRVGGHGDAAVRDLPALLARVGTVESMRFDPDSDGSSDVRLVFVRFRGWPLFWRLDLEVVGTFAPAAERAPWSQAESALMNVVAALKAAARQRGDLDGLLTRGFARIGAQDPGGPAVPRMRTLAGAAARCEPAQADLADRVAGAIGEFERGDATALS